MLVIFSILLIAGLTFSQFLSGLLGTTYFAFSKSVGFLSLIGLAFILIQVGYGFEPDGFRIRQYGWDFTVAMASAAFPWLCAASYFVFVLLPSEAWGSWQAWTEGLVVGRFASPTATGILFSMLLAAGLGNTWIFRKTRILAILNDLGTVLLMLPVKILMVGVAWQFGVVVIVMFLLLWMGLKWLHRVSVPVTWPWILGYACGIALLSELVYHGTKVIDYRVAIHIEVLLPAFVLGCVIKRPTNSDVRMNGSMTAHHKGTKWLEQECVSKVVSALFMMFVGLSMPPLLRRPVEVLSFPATPIQTITFATQPYPSWGLLLAHILILSLLINLGKMLPVFCYRNEAHWRERLAVALSMCPRGAIGAGVMILSLDYGIGGPIVSLAILSLALNLILTPIFVVMVKKLSDKLPAHRVLR